MSEEFLDPLRDGEYDNVPFEIRQKLWGALESVKLEWFWGLHSLSDEEIAIIQRAILPIMNDIYKDAYNRFVRDFEETTSLAISKTLDELFQ